jgi:hypothetical protein
MLRFANCLPFGLSCDLGAGERRNLRGTLASAAHSPPDGPWRTRGEVTPLGRVASRSPSTVVPT